MKRVHLLFIQCFLSASLLGGTATTTLTLAQEGSFGLIDVRVEAPGAPSSDTTTLSGVVGVELDIDTDTDTVSTLTALSSDITGTQVSFSGSTFLLSYTTTSSPVLGIGITTPTPPGTVNPLTGDYDASEHPFEINEGTLDGSATIFFSPTPIAVDFAVTPFGSSNAGTGNLSISLVSSDSTSKTYDVVMIYPVSTTTPLPVSADMTINVIITGTVKAVGTIVVPLLTEFEQWLSDNGLGEVGFDDPNAYGLANGLQWALGLSGNESPENNLLEYEATNVGTTTFTIDLPAGGSAADLTVVYAADITAPMTPLPTGAVNVGNPIPAGTTGPVTISITGDKGFLQLSAEAP